MSETGDRPTSRRAFAAAGALAFAALGARAGAEPTAPSDAANATVTPTAASSPAPPPPTPNSPARARDLGKLSNILYNNPAERQAFLADPPGYAVRLGLRYISAADLAAIRNTVADGFCCMGCGC